MPSVGSAAVSRIAYNERDRKLFITFRETGTYTYFDVPREEYEAFVASPSKGDFFNDRIRDRYDFKGQRLRPPHHNSGSVRRYSPSFPVRSREGRQQRGVD